MNKMKFMVLFMSVAMIFSGCASMNNTGKGAAIGGGRCFGCYPGRRYR